MKVNGSFEFKDLLSFLQTDSADLGMVHCVDLESGLEPASNLNTYPGCLKVLNAIDPVRAELFGG